MSNIREIPLTIMIVDPNDESAEILIQSLTGMKKIVLGVKRAKSLVEAQKALANGEINLIFIDPISLDLEKAGKFIFKTRKLSPSIEFVLYLDFNKMEHIRAEFYRGERRRLSHYFQLNKLTPIASFSDEVKATILACQVDISRRQKNEKITKLQEELTSIQSSSTAKTASLPLDILQDIQEQLSALKTSQLNEQTTEKPNTVFLSYRFAEAEYIEGLTTLLKQAGFETETGQDANTYISQAILERIRICEFFICLMTRADEKKDGTYTTSPWLLEEKGAALAMNKRIVLMVEDGVSDIGGLQGDWQRIHFGTKGFTSAAIRAVDQLKSYSGK